MGARPRVSAPVRAVKVVCRRQTTLRSPDSFGASILIERGPQTALRAVWGIQNNSRDCVAAVVLERAKGVEPSSKAWEALVLPMNYARIFGCPGAVSVGLSL